MAKKFLAQPSTSSPPAPPTRVASSQFYSSLHGPVVSSCLATVTSSAPATSLSSPLHQHHDSRGRRT